MNVAYQYYNELLRRALFFYSWGRVKAAPWDRIPSDMFLLMEFNMAFVGAGFILCFCCIFPIAWNFHFASTFEQDAWRAASLYMIVYGMAGITTMGFWMFVASREPDFEMSLFEKSLVDSSLHRLYTRFFGKPKAPSCPNGGRSQDGTLERTRRWLSQPHNISREKDPRLAVTVTFLLPNALLCMFYCIFRLYILMEDIVALRSLPSDAYATVNWVSFLPHV